MCFYKLGAPCKLGLAILSRARQEQLTICHEGQVQAFAPLGHDSAVDLLVQPFNATEPVHVPLDQPFPFEF